MSKAKDIIKLMEQEDRFSKQHDPEEPPDMDYFDKGEWIKVEPTGKALKKSYPAANWITKPQMVTLLDDAVKGTLDVFDVETKDGREESIYGFNIVGREG
jgi:hypothetical protein